VIDVGDNVTLHGGGFAYETAYVEEQFIGQSLPPQCIADDYFLTSGQLLYPGGGSSPG
jgi:hypothetical protein